LQGDFSNGFDCSALDAKFGRGRVTARSALSLEEKNDGQKMAAGDAIEVDNVIQLRFNNEDDTLEDADTESESRITVNGQNSR
jgi:hypothetical protein